MSIETAYRLFFQNKIEAAKKIVRRIIERSSAPKAYFLYALISYRENSLHEALWAIEKATEGDNEYYEAWILKSKILWAMKKHKKALECLDRAFEIQLRSEDYVDYEIFVYKAQIYLELGDVEKALEAVRKAKEINPSDDDVIEIEKKISELRKNERS